MSQSPLTVFYIFCMVFISIGLAYAEVAWLRKTLQWSAIWSPMIPLAVFNLVLLFIGLYVLSGYLALFIFPIPVIPVIFVLLKAPAYAIVSRKTGIEFHSPWLVAMVMIDGGSIVSSMLLSAAGMINPTYKNLY